MTRAFLKNLGISNKGPSINRPRAASLIYALVITAIVMVVAGSMATSFVMSSQRNYDLFKSTQAYYASRAAMEVAFLSANSNDIGYESVSTSPAISWDTNGDGSEDVYGDWEIFAKAKSVDWQGAGSTSCQTFLGWVMNCYVIPIPGTGNAGSSCDFTNPGGDDQLWDEDEDDKCNWNKIAHGETISIPLFYDGDASPFDGSQDFILRMRTPNGEWLDSSPSSDVIASWEFKGDCGGASCYLRPYLLSAYNYVKYDSINGANDHIVMQAQASGWGVTVITEGENNNDLREEIRDFLEHADNVYFKLTVVGALNENISLDSIPYLEYQIVVDKEIISDNKITYTADGYAEGRLGTYARHIQATQGLGSNSVINFALQN